MQRELMKDLIKWKESSRRKPLILKGARQVGKTYLLNEFGSKYYENIAYFNFDNDIELNNVFEQTKDSKRILEQLSLIVEKTIKPGKTLIIFDEVQECPNALNSLKYFNENSNEHHIVAAGSLLGIKLSNTSFPVGKVQYLDLKPMSFNEFLLANNHETYVEYMSKVNLESDFSSIASKLDENLKQYFIIGGMPEVVLEWTKYKDIDKVNEVQTNILNSMYDDFAKHTTNLEAARISLVWESIPSQFAKENRKFIYQVIKEGARAREFETAVNWLTSSNILYKSYCVKKTEIPLKAYQDISAFKIYVNDIGLLRKHSSLGSSFVKSSNFYGEFKGALTENYVFNHLVSDFDLAPSYFVFGNYEIDFVIQYKDEIIPVEVKSGFSTNNASLNNYIKKYNPKVAVRFCENELNLNGKILNVPIYLAGYLEKILECIEI